MKRMPIVIFTLVILTGLVLAGCVRPASKAPPGTATSELPFPVATQPNVMKDIIAGTQTALAAMGTIMPTSPADTAVPGVTVIAPSTAIPPEPTEKPVVPSATPGRPSTYIIQQGEFPFCIARRFNISPGALLNANGLTIDSRPSAGTELRIPDGPAWDAGPRALNPHPTTYSVPSGYSIYDVACHFGDVSPDAIMTANGLDSLEVSAGQVLDIP